MEKSLIKRLKATRVEIKANRAKVSRLKKVEKSVFNDLQDARMTLTEAEIAAKHGDREAYAAAYERVKHLEEDHNCLRDELRDAKADLEAQEQAFEVLQSEAAEWYAPEMQALIREYRKAEEQLDGIKARMRQLNKESSVAKLEIVRVPQVKNINFDTWNCAAYSPESDLQKVKQQYGLH